MMSLDVDALPASVGEASRTLINHLLDHGSTVEDDRGKAWRELRGVVTGMRAPHQRLFLSTHTPFAVRIAVARFVWLMRGDDALESIAYYAGGASRFSIDGFSIPGSSYGHRIRRGLINQDQLLGAIRRLRDSQHTRQAAVVIWQPIDAVREAHDIPCAMGLQFLVREGGLHAITMMRSNKPFRLLPHNFFEFSLLAEVVAAELSVPLHRYVHWVTVAQLPEVEVQAARSFVDEGMTDLAMPPMPGHVSSLAQCDTLCRIEQKLRMCRTEAELLRTLDDARTLQADYWFDFSLVLSTQWYLRDGAAEAALRTLEGTSTSVLVRAAVFELERAIARCS
jgi:thymidylate synthase